MDQAQTFFAVRLPPLQTQFLQGNGKIVQSGVEKTSDIRSFQAVNPPLFQTQPVGDEMGKRTRAEPFQAGNTRPEVLAVKLQAGFGPERPFPVFVKYAAEQPFAGLPPPFPPGKPVVDIPPEGMHSRPFF